jgi:hypothetical protein
MRGFFFPSQPATSVEVLTKSRARIQERTRARGSPSQIMGVDGWRIPVFRLFGRNGILDFFRRVTGGL